MENSELGASKIEVSFGKMSINMSKAEVRIDLFLRVAQGSHVLRLPTAMVEPSPSFAFLEWPCACCYLLVLSFSQSVKEWRLRFLILFIYECFTLNLNSRHIKNYIYGWRPRLYNFCALYILQIDVNVPELNVR